MMSRETAKSPVCLGAAIAVVLSLFAFTSTSQAQAQLGAPGQPMRQPGSATRLFLDLDRAVMREAIPEAPATPDKARRLLLFAPEPWVRTSSEDLAITALQEIAYNTKAFSLDVSYDGRELRSSNVIEKWDAVAVLNRPWSLMIDADAQDTLADYLMSGGGLFILNDGEPLAYNADERLAELTWMGSAAGDDWLDHMRGPADADAETSTVVPENRAVTILEPEHHLCVWASDVLFASPVRANLGEDARESIAEDSRILLEAENRNGGHVPMAWIRWVGEGRVVTTSVEDLWDAAKTDDVLKFWTYGLQFALGDLTAELGSTAQLPDDLTIEGALDTARTWNRRTGRYVRSLLVNESHRAMDTNDAEARELLESTFTEWLSDSDATPEAQEFAARMLGIVGTKSSLDVLMAERDDPQHGAAAHESLVRLYARGFSTTETEPDEIDAHLWSTAKTVEADAAKRAISLEALGRRSAEKYAEWTVDAFLEHSNRDLQLAAIRLIRETGDPIHTLPLFRVYLNSADEALVEELADAAVALLVTSPNGRMGYARSMMAISDNDGETDERDIRRAGEITARVGGMRSLLPLTLGRKANTVESDCHLLDVLIRFPDAIGFKILETVLNEGRCPQRVDEAVIDLIYKMSFFPGQPVTKLNQIEFALSFSESDACREFAVRTLGEVNAIASYQMLDSFIEDSRLQDEAIHSALSVVVRVSQDEPVTGRRMFTELRDRAEQLGAFEGETGAYLRKRFEYAESALG